MYKNLSTNEKIVSLLAFLIGFFHLLNAAGVLILSTLDVRIFHLLVMMLIIFISKPLLKNKDNNFFRFINLILIFLALLSFFHLLSRWEEIALSGGDTESIDAIAGLVIIFLVFEATRRGIGFFLTLICLIFFTYPFYSQYLPGVFEGRGYSPLRMSEFLTTTSEGVFGVPIGVSATYIILFTIFGSFLTEFGAGDFFFKVSKTLTKNLRAAGAKTAVVFSTLVGMISGAAASNVAVTGVMTIPMMKKEGYESRQAGAIEAVVSTGGQIMPPVMGAAAFIMAEIIGIPYSEVMKAALIPALLFFTSIYFIVDFLAGKNKIIPLNYNDGEKFYKTFKSGMRFVIPFLSLIIFLIYGYSPFKASFYSICLIVFLEIVHRRKIDIDLVKKIILAITNGAKNVAPIAIACAAAGIIAGTLSITGLGSKISTLIIYASTGIPILALFLTMITAIILGMGLPTTAAYLVLATVVAPALTKLDVPILTAHMFVFYYGCLSTITPPVALSSFVAAGISGAKINEVGWTAFSYGISSYIVPFIFFFGPGLFLEGELIEIVVAVTTAFVGIYLISSSVVGYYKKEINYFTRILFFTSGLLLMLQGYNFDLIGAIIFIIWFFYQKFNLKNKER